MSMDKPWKIALVLLGIFIAGALTGGAIVVRVGRTMAVKHAMPDQWTPMQMKRLVDRLDLTPEQMDQLRPIVRRNMNDLNRLRTYTFTETRSTIERMERDIAEKLTPEQRERFERMNKEMRERAQRFQQERGGRQQQMAPGDGSRRFGPSDGRERPMRDRRSDEKPADGPPDKPPGT